MKLLISSFYINHLKKKQSRKPKRIRLRIHPNNARTNNGQTIPSNPRKFP